MGLLSHYYQNITILLHYQPALLVKRKCVFVIVATLNCDAGQLTFKKSTGNNGSIPLQFIDL